MKKLKQPPSGPLPSDGMNTQDMEVTLMRMEMYDSMCPQERALVQEFGLKLGMEAARANYGRWDDAWQAAERQRKALQVQRLRNITISGLPWVNTKG